MNKKFLLLSLIVITLGATLFFLHEEGSSKSLCEKTFPKQSQVCNISNIILENVESIAIVSGVFLYFLEASDRKSRKYYEAWQVIDQASSSNITTSYARIKALEDLCKDQVPLHNLVALKANLSHIKLASAQLERAELSEANLNFANLTESELTGAQLFNVSLIQAILIGAILDGARLDGATLSGADLQGASLIGTNFTNADLRDANLDLAQLKNTIINRFDTLNDKYILAWSIINGKQNNTDLSNKILSYTYLSEVSFNGFILNNVNFEGSVLCNADFNKCQMESANLKGANLKGANLKGANLKGANFEGADLFGVDIDHETIGLPVRYIVINRVIKLLKIYQKIIRR